MKIRSRSEARVSSRLPTLLAQVWNNKSFTDFDQKYFVRGDHPLYLAVYAGLAG